MTEQSRSIIVNLDVFYQTQRNTTTATVEHILGEECHFPVITDFSDTLVGYAKT